MLPTALYRDSDDHRGRSQLIPRRHKWGRYGEGPGWRSRLAEATGWVAVDRGRSIAVNSGRRGYLNDACLMGGQASFFVYFWGEIGTLSAININIRFNLILINELGRISS